MGDRHTSVEKYSLVEHAQLRQSLHYKTLLDHQRQGRIFLPENFASDPSMASEWSLDDYYFLQPVHTRQRRAMLREAGVVRIDPSEREECRSLRMSRGRCGCSCREICQPPSCACCRSGIGCQVDQMAFPCSCVRSGCANPHGRVEFNAARVRAHFIRTLLQLGLEQSAAAADDYYSSLPLPAKRCRIENEHPEASFPSSSSSLLVNSSCPDRPLLSTANGFEPETMYFDSLERLSGPETMVVAYDEDCDEENDESSSETSVDDGTGFDGVPDGADDGSTMEAVHDSRQRTMDDYVVRFNRPQMYMQNSEGPSICSLGSYGSYAADLRMGTEAAEELSLPLSCTVTCTATPRCHPAVSSPIAETMYTSCPTGSFSHRYCDCALPDKIADTDSLPESMSDSCRHPTASVNHGICNNTPASCYAANDHNSVVSGDSTADNFEHEFAVSCATQNSNIRSCTVTASSSEPQMTACTCANLYGDPKHGYNSVCNWSMAGDESCNTTPENDARVSFQQDVTNTQSLAVCDSDTCSSTVADSTALSCITVSRDDRRNNTGSDSSLSNNVMDERCFLPQDTSDLPLRSEHCYCCSSHNAASSGFSASSIGSNGTKIADTGSADLVPDDNTSDDRDPGTFAEGSSSAAETVVGCSMPDNTGACLAADACNLPVDSQTPATADGCCVPDETKHSQGDGPVGDTPMDYYSASLNERPVDRDGCVVPEDDSMVPCNDGENSYSTSDLAASSCTVKQSNEPDGCCARSEYDEVGATYSCS